MREAAICGNFMPHARKLHGQDTRDSAKIVAYAVGMLTTLAVLLRVRSRPSLKITTEIKGENA